MRRGENYPEDALDTRREVLIQEWNEFRELEKRTRMQRVLKVVVVNSSSQLALPRV